MTITPVVEVGGTHVSAALVDTSTWRTISETLTHDSLRSNGTANDILADLTAAIGRLGSCRGSILGIAIPGPFDYEHGIGRFRDVGKFDALNGVNMKRVLLATLREPPNDIRFVNDAVAFAIGEWVSGAAQGVARTVAITLGTGVGSAFLVSGTPITSGREVPPDGAVHLLRIGDQPLEDIVSRRAIVAAYRAITADYGRHLDVHDIARRAADGDTAARTTLDTAFRALGMAIAPWLVNFGAEVLVVGGGIAAAWKQIAPCLREGLVGPAAGHRNSWPVDNVVYAPDTQESGLVGVAWHVAQNPTTGPTSPSHR
jgi:glucokinase